VVPNTQSFASRRDAGILDPNSTVHANDPRIPNATNPNLILRKTLQLTFQRLGDGRRNEPGDITFLSSMWVYRSASLEGATITPPPMPKKPDEPKE